MNSAPARITAAVRHTILRATFEFEHFLKARQEFGISMITRGYADLSEAVVAAEMTMDLTPEETEEPAGPIRMWTFHSGTTLYQCTSTEGDRWVSLDSPGIGATVLAPLYWLYGVQEADEDGAFTLSFPHMLSTAPEARSLREGLSQTRPDLLSATATGQLTLAPDDTVAAIEVELPGYDAPDPELAQPPSIVTLSLDPTARRDIELPTPDTHTTPDTFTQILFSQDD